MKNYSRFSTATLLTLTFSCASLAASEPSVTGIAGVAQHGQSLTISGNGFGSKSPVAPIKFDNFDDGATGAYLLDKDAQWKSYSGNKGLAYSDSAPHSGSLALRQHNGNGERFTSNFFTYTPASEELFVSHWWRVDVKVSGRTIIKMTRLSSSKAAGGGGVYNGAGNTSLGGSYNLGSPTAGPYCAYNNGVINESPLTGDWKTSHFDAPPRSTWVRVDSYKKLSTPGVADGILEYRLHLDEKTNKAAVTRGTGFAFKLDSVLLGTMEGSDKEHDYVVSIDDVYIDNTRARVEICDTPTWVARTHSEIQIPHTQWDNGQLQITLNQGSFAPGSTQYLYVVNSEGLVNATGYPIVLGVQAEHKQTDLTVR